MTSRNQYKNIILSSRSVAVDTNGISEAVKKVSHWWQETSPDYSMERSMELIGLMRRLIDRDECIERDEQTDEFEYSWGVGLRCYHPGVEQNINVPLVTTYVLLSQYFIIKMRYTRHAVKQNSYCSLECVENAKKAKQWLLYELTRNRFNDFTSH